jgi:endogenous inhibitor of DNA gyrase (YacG/DUF329 family)
MPEDKKPTSAKCPICGRQTDAHYRPFCSRRCADVDLARWLGGKYAIASHDHDDDEDGDLGKPGGDGNADSDGSGPVH